MQQIKDPVIDKFTKIMDEAFTLPGTKFRFGLDALLGLIPGFGDGLSSVMSLYILGKAYTAGARTSILLRMMMNIFVDQFIGSIPILGDLFDFVWKSNRKNTQLYYEFLNTPRQTKRKSTWWLVVMISAIVIALVLMVMGMVELISWIVRSVSY